MPDEITGDVAYDQYLTDMKSGAVAAQGKETTIAREYYDGDHATQITERQKKYLQIKTGDEFNSNYCPIVVDALAERLKVTGFRMEDEAQAQLLWGWWGKSRMDHWQGVIHTAAVRDGNSFVIVEWDEDLGIPIWTYEPAWNGTNGVRIHYGDGKRQEAQFASKRWRTGAGSQERLNLYLPSIVLKYERRAGDAGVEGVKTDWNEIESSEWTTKDGEPLGIPVIHYRNKDQGYNYGDSELKNVTPLQNALNKAIIDLVAAADTTAFRIYWMIGDDPTDLEVVPGSWIYSTKPPADVQIGHIPGEDLSKMIEFKDSFAMEVARVSRTPVSYFQISKQRPREETLQQEESGLVSRAKNRAITFGNSWEDTMVIAQRLWNTFGQPKDGEPTNIDPEAEISTLWGDFETRNDKKMLETLVLKKDLGIPEEFLWEEMGYSPDEVKEIRESPEYQNRLKQREAMAMMIGGGFDGGDGEDEDEGDEK